MSLFRQLLEDGQCPVSSALSLFFWEPTQHFPEFPESGRKPLKKTRGFPWEYAESEEKQSNMSLEIIYKHDLLLFHMALFHFTPVHIWKAQRRAELEFNKLLIGTSGCLAFLL